MLAGSARGRAGAPHETLLSHPWAQLWAHFWQRWGLPLALPLCLFASALASGCGDAASPSGTSAPQPLTVRWLLMDGRSCIDAAVVGVTIAVDDKTPVSQRCPATPGAVPALVLPAVTPGALLHARGLSASGAVLYRGEAVALDLGVPGLDMVLYYTGGQ